MVEYVENSGPRGSVRVLIPKDFVFRTKTKEVMGKTSFSAAMLNGGHNSCAPITVAFLIAILEGHGQEQMSRSKSKSIRKWPRVQRHVKVGHGIKVT